MKESDYIRRKNEIIKRETGGEELVPDNQIKDLGVFPELRLKQEPELGGDEDACPYCQAFPSSCDGCPMALAGNKCRELGSTYNEVVDILDGTITSDSNIRSALAKLIEQYNAEREYEISLIN